MDNLQVKISKVSIISTFLFLSHNLLVNNIFGVSGYVIGFLFSLIVLALFLIQGKRLSWHILYYIFMISFSQLLYLVINQSFQTGFIEGFALYIFVPLVATVFSEFLQSNKEFAFYFLKLFSVSTLISLSGAALYALSYYEILSGFEHIFVIEFAGSSFGRVLRNTSFYGSSLSASALYLLQACVCGFMFFKTRNKLFLILFLVCGVLIAFTLSRRALIPYIYLYLILIFLLWKSDRWLLIGTPLAVLTVVCLVAPHFVLTFLERIASIVDFDNDYSGNSGRIRLMFYGIGIILENPFGVGWVNLSSVGKDWQDIFRTMDQLNGFISVVESSYLVFIGEIGAFFVMLLLPVLFHILSCISRSSKLFVLVPILLESAVGLSIYTAIGLLSTLVLVGAINVNENEH